MFNYRKLILPLHNIQESTIAEDADDSADEVAEDVGVVLVHPEEFKGDVAVDKVTDMCATLVKKRDISSSSKV